MSLPCSDRDHASGFPDTNRQDGVPRSSLLMKREIASEKHPTNDTGSGSKNLASKTRTASCPTPELYGVSFSIE